MKKVLFFSFFILLILAYFWWQNGISAVNVLNKSTQTVVITSGEGTRGVGDALKTKGLIKDSLVFVLMVKLSGLDGKIQAGDFTLSPSMNLPTIADTLTKGTQDAWVTIPEGKRATEIAEIFKAKLPSYNSSWDSKLIANEGYLFPDTYSFPKDISVDEVIKIMRDNFDKKYAEASQNKSVNLSENEAVILASIVEREAISPHDKSYVASTLENRLSIGMALGSDVTLEYALGYQPQEQTWWKQNLTVDDLQLQTPYNTRLNAGLPPTPISNPGLVSLRAVLNPPSTNYLYYVSDSKGVLHFATTLEQHNANVAKYGE
ncbi:MAG TPA: endolytic transglycosylase MltG [Candidatus Saccharimonadales bacterium]|nr:endolytic transglycosylase MltG [Candidatus Saccharimonadales bacterium]